MKAAILIIIFSISGLSANKSVKKNDESAPSKEILEIAQNLILQKDRDQAIRILYKAQLIEKNKTVLNEIRAILRDIGSLFLYDKAQQEFESSINFKKTDPSKSLAAIERAQKIEPDNTLLMVELIRNQINKKNTDKAKEILDEFRLKNAYDKNVVLAGIFLSFITGDMKDAGLAKTRLKDLQLDNSIIISSYVEFLDRVNGGQKDKMATALAHLKKEDKLNPQITFWENRLSGRPRAEEEPLCAPFPEHFYRRYFYDLFFCSPVLEHYFKLKTVN